MVDEIAYRIRHSDRLRIVFADADRDVAGETQGYLVEARKTVLAFFGIADLLPAFSVFLCPDRKEFDRFVAHVTATPTPKERVAQPQGTDLYLLSPRAFPTDADCYAHPPDRAYDPDEHRRTVVHEVVHMVEEHLSPKGAMEVRPAWWSEGLAVYVSGQYAQDDFRRPLREDLAAGRIPAFDPGAPGEGARAYVWGWTVVKYVEATYGRGQLLDIVRRNNGPDIFETLGRSAAAEYRKWRQWVTDPRPHA